MVFGNLGYFLGQLIRSAPRGNEHSLAQYVALQVVMVASLAGALAMGQIFGFKSMRNTASTFAVLYFTMKISVISLAEDMGL